MNERRGWFKERDRQGRGRRREKAEENGVRKSPLRWSFGGVWLGQPSCCLRTILWILAFGSLLCALRSCTRTSTGRTRTVEQLPYSIVELRCRRWILVKVTVQQHLGCLPLAKVVAFSLVICTTRHSFFKRVTIAEAIGQGTLLQAVEGNPVIMLTTN